MHFHLHPRSGARIDPDGSAQLILAGGERWRLSASGAALTIEESTYYAEMIGPLQAQQVVLRAVCYGAAEVHWVLERVRHGATHPSRRPILLRNQPEPMAAAEADGDTSESSLHRIRRRADVTFAPVSRPLSMLTGRVQARFGNEGLLP